MIQICNRRGISTETKIKVYPPVVLTKLLCSCETRAVYQRHARKTSHLQTTCLREILGIKLQDKVPDTEVLNRAGLPSIHTILMQSQVHMTGHVACMPDSRLPKQLLYGELQHEGKRSCGGRKKRFKGTLKASLKAFSFNSYIWEQRAQDRGKWRTAVHKSAKSCVNSRIAVAKQ